jgi:hypothetical protein
MKDTPLGADSMAFLRNENPRTPRLQPCQKVSKIDPALAAGATGRAR